MLLDQVLEFCTHCFSLISGPILVLSSSLLVLLLVLVLVQFNVLFPQAGVPALIWKLGPAY